MMQPSVVRPREKYPSAGNFSRAYETRHTTVQGPPRSVVRSRVKVTVRSRAAPKTRFSISLSHSVSVCSSVYEASTLDCAARPTDACAFLRITRVRFGQRSCTHRVPTSRGQGLGNRFVRDSRCPTTGPTKREHSSAVKSDGPTRFFCCLRIRPARRTRGPRLFYGFSGNALLSVC